MQFVPLPRLKFLGFHLIYEKVPLQGLDGLYDLRARGWHQRLLRTSANEANSHKYYGHNRNCHCTEESKTQAAHALVLSCSQARLPTYHSPMAPRRQVRNMHRTRHLHHSGRWDLNPQQPAWKADALPIELRPRAPASNSRREVETGSGWIRTTEGRRPTDLQSVPFVHSGTLPSGKTSKLRHRPRHVKPLAGATSKSRNRTCRQLIALALAHRSNYTPMTKSRPAR